MQILTILVTLAGLLYGGYWVVGHRTVERAARATLDGLADQGIEVAYDSLETHGFPSRFDTSVVALDLRDPATGAGWQAPMVQVVALAYRPNRAIVVWPDTQTVTLPGQRLDVRSSDLRASVTLRPLPDLPLDHATLDGTALAIASDLNWTLRIGHLLSAIRTVPQAPDGVAAYDVFAEATQIAATLPGAASLPGADRLRLDLGVTLDTPLDRSAAEIPPRITALTLRGLTLAWDGATLEADGAVTVAPDGTLDGALTLRFGDWRRMLALAQSAGLIEDRVQRSLDRLVGLLAGGAAAYTLPITIADGLMMANGFPLGPAPRLAQRQ